VHWLQHLRDNVGFRGWRFDFAKVGLSWLVVLWCCAHLTCAHTNTHTHPQGYGAQYIKQYVHESGAGGDMNVGELWADLDWQDGGE
jgi:hypothetical protein